MSATLAQFFKYFWFMPSLGVRSPCPKRSRKKVIIGRLGHGSTYFSEKLVSLTFIRNKVAWKLSEREVQHISRLGFWVFLGFGQEIGKEETCFVVVSLASSWYLSSSFLCSLKIKLTKMQHTQKLTLVLMMRIDYKMMK